MLKEIGSNADSLDKSDMTQFFFKKELSHRNKSPDMQSQISKISHMSQELNIVKLNLQSNVNVIEKSAFANQNEATGRIHELETMLDVQNKNQKKLNIKIGFLESQLDDLNDNCQLLEQENKALKETNNFLKKMNLDIQSKHQRTFYASMLEDHSIGPTKTRSFVSNSFIELANEMKKTYSNGGDLTAKKSDY